MTGKRSGRSLGQCHSANSRQTNKYPLEHYEGYADMKKKGNFRSKTKPPRNSFYDLRRENRKITEFTINYTSRICLRLVSFPTITGYNLLLFKIGLTEVNLSRIYRKR